LLAGGTSGLIAYLSYLAGDYLGFKTLRFPPENSRLSWPVNTHTTLAPQAAGMIGPTASATWPATSRAPRHPDLAGDTLERENPTQISVSLPVPTTFVLQAAGMIGLTAYLSYLAGDYLGFSGIVSLFCCAVVISHYAMPNISKQQRAATLSLYETLSFLSEGSIFVYVGLDALDPQKWANTYARECVALVFFSLFLLLFSRALFVFPILTLHNLWAEQKLSRSEIMVSWYTH